MDGLANLRTRTQDLMSRGRDEEPRVARLRGERDKLRESLEQLRDQRDALRSSRDQFRKQRDQFREQRNTLREQTAQLRSGPLFFCPTSALSSATCPACDSDQAHVSTYPYAMSKTFSRCLVLWCGTCGMGWVPALPIDLALYYQTEYATTNRKDRDISPEVYFGPKSPFAKSTYFARAKSQIRRAKEHLGELNAMLDFGSGPGYALYQSGAKTLHAIEHDEHSTKYLEHIGAERKTIDTLPDGFYDLVLSSHSLEHLEASDLYSTLDKLKRALRPGGVLYIEVPGGALTHYRAVVRHEPHTLFFSPESLQRVLQRAGFDIEFAGTLASSENPRLTTPLYAPDTADEFKASTRGRLTIVARRPDSAGDQPATPEIPRVSSCVFGTTPDDDSEDAPG